jgi:hypothetical protein
MRIEDFEYENFIGKSTLFYGETDTRKTYYTAKFIDYLIEYQKYDPKEISILDFAPELMLINGLKIGGKINDFSNKSVNCSTIRLEGEIIPARLKAQNKRELFENICHNYKITLQALEEFNQSTTSFLIINDVSIYLHLGDKSFLLNTIKKASTFCGNSYYGDTIKSGYGKLLSLKEKKRVEFLIKNLDNPILTNFY